MLPPSLGYEDYTVGWICALPTELTAATFMLDETHPDLPPPPTDHNTYFLGRIGEHNIAIAYLPKEEIGNNPAATGAARMLSTFPAIRFGLIVGIGGGVPTKDSDIRLGDVVVSIPADQNEGVVQRDFENSAKGGLSQRTSTLSSPPTILKTALSTLEATHKREGSKVPKYLSNIVARHPTLLSEFNRPAAEDVLFEADYDHIDSSDSCSAYDIEKAVPRPPRDDFVVHYSTIKSGNQVMKHGAKRDEVSKGLDDALCFEMEAAGLLNGLPCLVICGVCDYADSHKTQSWHPYAAATAAAFAKELLSVIPSQEIDGTTEAADVLQGTLDPQLLHSKRILLL
jgi:nucleoside phosphorylase